MSSSGLDPKTLLAYRENLPQFLCGRKWTNGRVRRCGIRHQYVCCQYVSFFDPENQRPDPPPSISDPLNLRFELPASENPEKCFFVKIQILMFLWPLTLTQRSIRTNYILFQNNAETSAWNPSVMCTSKSIAYEDHRVPPLYSYRVRVFTIRLSFLLATKPDIWEISKPLVMWDISRQFGFWLSFLCILRLFPGDLR